jgi:hypothetical protein
VDEYADVVRTRPDLDEQIRLWILDRFRRGKAWGSSSDIGLREHLRECPDTKVTEPEWYPESGYCPTCAESAHLEAEVSCSHGYKDSIYYAAFGDLPEIISALDEWLAAQDA